MQIMEKEEQIKTAFTAGPWEVWKSNAEVFARTTSNTPFQISGTRICRLPDNLDWSDLPEERDANANLIAAAPDLLEALKLAEMEIKALYPRLGYNNSNVLATIQSAISKAIGQ